MAGKRIAQGFRQLGIATAVILVVMLDKESSVTALFMGTWDDILAAASFAFLLTHGWVLAGFVRG
jgi:hypothetical protein